MSRRLGLLYIALPLLLACQTHASDPVVTSTGEGRVHAPPTHATAIISLQARSRTPAQATAAVNAAGAGLMDTLKAHSSIDSLNLGALFVTPNLSDDGRLQGYSASLRLSFRTSQLDSVGAYLRSALQAGATGLDQVTFTAGDLGKLRQEALAHAIAKARADAEALASASGHRLGRLISLSSEMDAFSMEVRAFESASIVTDPTVAEFGNAASRSVALGPTPRGIPVTAMATGKWELVAD